MNQFTELPLTPPILKSLERMEYTKPTDVQAQTIPFVLDGRDVLVTAQTGTGKTAAFAVPIFQRMIAQLEAGEPVRRALVLAPTRELAEQIGLVMKELTFFFRRIRYTVIIGGAPYGKQFRELNMDPAFVVGTPGRLIDHIETGTLKLQDFDYLVLDESDRMLDMGFAPQIEMIVKKFPVVRQTMMFSATLPTEVRGLVAKYLKNPARVAIGEENRPVAKIKQDVIEVREADKTPKLMHEIDGMAGSIIVFTKTKVKADVVASMLADAGHQAEALHGDLTQGARRRVTTKFRGGEIRILVATDIAARGLDIDHVRHVVNYDLPMVPEDYIHRIGRTGRAGKEGHSIAFVTQQERGRWNQILRIMGLPSQGQGRGAARSGYKNASAKSAFSSVSPKDRPKPFATAYEAMAPVKKFAKPSRVGDARKGAVSTKSDKSAYKYGPQTPRPEKPERAERTERTERPQRENPKPYKFGRKADRPARRERTAEHTDGYNSAKAQKIRDEFESRSEFAQKQRAGKLGYAPRSTPDARGAHAPTPSFGAKQNLVGGAKPHKGALDTRKRKPSFARSASSSTKPWSGPVAGSATRR